MLAKVEIVHKFCFFKFRILFQGKTKIDASKTPRSVSHFWICENLIC